MELQVSLFHCCGKQAYFYHRQVAPDAISLPHPALACWPEQIQQQIDLILANQKKTPFPHALCHHEQFIANLLPAPEKKRKTQHSS